MLAITVLVSGLWYNSAAFLARRSFAQIRGVYLNKNIPEQQLKELYRRTEKATSLDFLEGEYPFTMGNISLFLGLREQARDEYLQASTLNPLSGRFIQQLGLSLDPTQDKTTDRLLAMGSVYEPLILDRYITYASHLIATGNRQRAMTTINRALEKHPQWVSRLNGFVFLNQLTRNEIEVMLPPHPQPWYEMGRLWEKEGEKMEATHYYLQALELLDTHEPRPEYFSRLYSMYLRQKEDDKALAVLRSGIEHLPDNASFHKYLGDHYRKEGITYRAMEEYRQSLQLNPKDVGLKRRLDDLETKGEEGR